MATRTLSRNRLYQGEERSKYPTYIQVILGLLVLGVIFALPGLSAHFTSAVDESDPVNPGLRGRTTQKPPSREIVFQPEYHLKIIADLDQRSFVQGAKKPTWTSTLFDLTLKRDPATAAWSVVFGEQHDLHTNHNEAGRGMELSELVKFNNKLYSMDDRTGIVFEITKDFKAVPRHIVMEGDGMSTKGQKIEWATVKDNEMYVGSIGKEYTLPDGSIGSLGGLWVAAINKDGRVKYIDWTVNYGNLRKVTGTAHPGYLLHEAITWSEILQKWVVLPRRVSTDPYDENLDNERGSNYIILADKDFSHVEYRRIGNVTPIRGFSTFKFLPGSNDQIIVALKSEEHPDTGLQSAYITVLSIAGDGKVLMEETQIPGERKYEGLEFDD